MISSIILALGLATTPASAETQITETKSVQQETATRKIKVATRKIKVATRKIKVATRKIKVSESL